LSVRLSVELEMVNLISFDIEIAYKPTTTY